eukprot:3451120-Prymnesium_polylepis.1
MSKSPLSRLLRQRCMTHAVAAWPPEPARGSANLSRPAERCRRMCWEPGLELGGGLSHCAPPLLVYMYTVRDTHTSNEQDERSFMCS